MAGGQASAAHGSGLHGMQLWQQQGRRTVLVTLQQPRELLIQVVNLLQTQHTYNTGIAKKICLRKFRRYRRGLAGQCSCQRTLCTAAATHSCAGQGGLGLFSQPVTKVRQRHAGLAYQPLQHLASRAAAQLTQQVGADLQGRS